MKKFLPYIFILLSNLCFGSFPVQNNLYNDTIIERKKETREEYQQRIQKQLFSNDDDLYQESINQYESRKKVKKNLSKWRKIHPFIRFFIIIVGLALVLFIGALISLAINPPSFSIDLDDLSND